MLLNKNNQSTQIEPGVEVPPTIDANQFFQKDPETPKVPPIYNLVARFGKRNVFVAGIVVLLLFFGGGLIFAGVKMAANEPGYDQLAENGSTDEFYEDTEGEFVGDESNPEEFPTEDVGIPAEDTGMQEPQPGEGYEEPYPEEFIPIDEVLPEPIPPKETPPPTVVRTYSIGYTDNCFTPADITINRGEAVRFTNNSTRDMWPASDKHPSHSLYPEFDSTGTIAPGDSYTFTFAKAGTWDYHDHLKLKCGGTITVR